MGNSKYDEFLEMVVRYIYENNPTSILIMLQIDNGNVLEAEYGCGAEEKAMFSQQLQHDIVMDMIKSNIGIIKEMLEEERQD